MSAPPSLLWELVKDNNSFLVKKHGVTFNREKGNLTNLNTYTHSGVVQKKAVDIQPGKDKGAIVVSLKSSSSSKQRKPAKSWSSVTYKTNSRRLQRILRKRLVSYGRPDLVPVALARASQLVKAQRTKPAKRSARAAPKATTPAKQ